MATQVQYRRGTNAQNAAFTGALAEITVDTTNGTLRVHDGLTAGGSNIATVSYVTAQISSLSSNSISFGTSNVRVSSSGGNVVTSVGGTANVLNVTSTGAIITGDLSVTGNATLSGNILGDRIINGTTSIEIETASANANVSVGGTSNVAVFASSGVFVTGVNSVSGNITGGNILTAGLISATGNITGGNLRTAGLISATGSITTAGDISITGNIVDGAALTISTSSNGNITLAPNGTGVVVVNTDIRNGQANATGNIGSSTGYFNTVFAKATSAQYADLAEMYVADADYVSGTVVEFGGLAEITQSTASHSTRVAGIVSTNPSYLMNATQTGDHVLPVALTGRVPCQVVGHIAKGDRLVASNRPGVATVLDMTQYQPACIIGKALEAYDSDTIGIIEVAVGRF
jgi:hypothetical protein